MKKILKMLTVLSLILTALSTNVSASDNEDIYSDDNISEDDYYMDRFLSDRSENKSGNVETNGDQIVPFIPYIETYSTGPGIVDDSYPEGTYNWVYDWDISMEKYNCYAFVVGMTYGFLVPGDLSGRPSDTSIGELSISEINNYIINDLKSLGFTNVKEVSSSYKPSSNEYKIAFRRGYDNNGDFKDFHFMILDNSSGYWLHKPGESAILIYKRTSISSAWPHEIYDGSRWRINNSFTYNGTISYFAFKD